MNNRFVSNLLADALENYVKEKRLPGSSYKHEDDLSAAKYSNYLANLSNLTVRAH